MKITPFTTDGNWKARPQLSPDGEKVACEWSGVDHDNLDIYVKALGLGTSPLRLTEHPAGDMFAAWFPDGRRLAFVRAIEEGAAIYTVPALGGQESKRRLTLNSSTDSPGSWSRDGGWIYFSSDRGGSVQVWKIPVEGGEAVRVTQGGGVYPQESWDGRYLYYASSGFNPGIWRVPVNGGDETEIVPGPIAASVGWALSPSGVYFATKRMESVISEEYTIQHLDLESGQVTQLVRREGDLDHIRVRLAVSPGEEWILFGESGAWKSELMLVENFR